MTRGRSERSGETFTNTAPRRAAAAIAPRSTCALIPPPPTALFLRFIPPKASRGSVCAATWSQVTVPFDTTSDGPRTCRRTVCAAAPL
ncbi:hypothetical protein [Pseudonocardia sp. NPDC049154]|uniref:hypothetical protein n=1 Tax=Pseudonocardia sp. NPDC049154 TaxID=3155501 RepID=UPI0033E2BBC4